MTRRPDVLGVLRVICTVVGAFVLYCAVIAALWYAFVRAVRRHNRRQNNRQNRQHSRRQAGQPAAGRGGPEVDPPQWQSRPWDELPSWLWPDRSWAVAVVLLDAPAVRDRTARFVDFDHHVIDWTGLLGESRGWPAEQRLLVQDAYEAARQVRRSRLEPEDGITTLS